MTNKTEHRVRDLRILVVGSSSVTIIGIMAVIILAYSQLPEASMAPLVVALGSIIAGFVTSLTGIARLVEIGEKLTPYSTDENSNTQSGSESQPP